MNQSLNYLILATVISLSVDLAAQSDTSIFVEPVVIAEWERAEGVFISYPFRLPEKLVKDFAEDTQLYILIQETNRNKAVEELQQLDIDSGKVKFIECSVDSEWPRDWGPHQIFDKKGEFGIVDPDFDGYPAYRQAGGDPVYTFRPGKGDDKVNSEIASHLNVKVDHCPAFVTGGNFLVDGFGTAFCTQAMLEENSRDYNQETFSKRLQQELGIKQLVLLENTEAVGIQHIDCWMKVLNPGTLLVKRAPEGHADEAFLESNVKRLSKMKSAYERPYRIVRIDCPRVKVARFNREADPIAAYTNSLILNDKVYVPLFDCEGDEAALETWRNALPGYEVKGYVFDKWKDFDALHCRSRALFDRTAIRLNHVPIVGKVKHSDQGFPVLVQLRGAELDGRKRFRAALFYRKQGQAEWSQTLLEFNNKLSGWTGNIPGFETGTRVEYYLTVTEESGNSANQPVVAPRSFYQFEIVDQLRRGE